MSKQNLARKKIWAGKKFGSEKILAEKKLWLKFDGKKFGSKKIWAGKKCGSKKNLGLTFFGLKNLNRKNLLGKKNVGQSWMKYVSFCEPVY